MNNALQLAWLIPFFPLLGFLINGLGRKSLSKSLIGVIGCGVILASFVISVWVFLEVKAGNVYTANYFDFISVGTLQIPFSFQLTSFLQYFF